MLRTAHFPVSSDPIISVENLSKRYIIGRQRDRRDALRHRLEGALRAPFTWLRARVGEKRQRNDEFWALKDVSFEIKQGEVVGIVGRNGAGKSTLLKILSRITEPTEGRIRLQGRVASLLEVGTGFHGELTGRENVFLNGAILGMSKAEIRRKFDEIVAFSEIEKFLDTPVKRYSSGMYVRLAFAVAANLEPDILVVDEVLAVGDAAFQRKSLGKMNDVARSGRTVLFVSHNMAAIQSLCQRAVLLDSGHLAADGEAASVVRRYLSAGEEAARVELSNRTDRKGDGSVRLKFVHVEAADKSGPIVSTSGIRITVGYKSNDSVIRPRIMIGIYDENEVRIYGLDSYVVGGISETLPPEGALISVTGPLNLAEGSCWLNIALFSGEDPRGSRSARR